MVAKVGRNNVPPAQNRTDPQQLQRLGQKIKANPAVPITNNSLKIGETLTGMCLS
jgi:hypothetical protein